MERTHFTVGAGSGQLSGWLAGRGQRVVALHGGPGMDYCYLDDAVLELATRYQVATFQQRGLAPPTESGEFTIAEALADHAAAPPMPHLQISQAAHLGLWADLQDRLPELESSLPSI